MRAGIADVGGEPDLIVDDDVDGAASGVAGESGEVERLGDDALSGERRVAVEEDRHRAVAILRRRPGLAAVVLGGAGHPLHDRVDELEVTRVRGEHERHLDGLPIRGSRPPRPEVVLHVAGDTVVARGVGRRGAARHAPFEGGDDRGVGLAQDVRQDIEATAVGHAQHDLAHAVGGGIADDRVEHRHQRIGAFDRESLLTEIGLVQETLEALDLGQALEQLFLLLGGEVRGVMAALGRLAQPGALLGDLDLIEVIADAAAVDAAQVVDSLLGIGGIGIGRPGDRFDR